jgi:ribosomal protein S18 acetylase RimI-like enzyme
MQTHANGAKSILSRAPSATLDEHSEKVVPALPSSEPEVVRIILSAFVADPAARWMYPEESEYQTYFLAFVRAFAGAAFLTGSAHVVGSGSGAALWLPPGNHPDDHELAGLIGRSIPAWRRGAVFSVFEEMGRYHPLDPHWHLPLIGVEPSEHRRGLGSSLLRHGLRICDEQRLPAYLESSHPDNIPLYQRHGFEILGTIQVDSSPPITPMLRRASACSRRRVSKLEVRRSN